MNDALINAEDAKNFVQEMIKKYLVSDRPDIGKFGCEIAKWCCKYSNEKLSRNEAEVIISLMSLVLEAWSAWILESKAICHYGKPDEGWREFLEKTYIPSIKDTLVNAINLARDEKRKKQAEGDSGKDDDVPSNINIPQPYKLF